MKNLKNILTACFLLTIIVNTQGQNNANTSLNYSGIFNVSWQPSIPFGSQKEWIENTSFSGGSFEGLGFVSDNVAIGGEFSWNYTYKKFDSKTYEFDSKNYEAALTGVQHRSSSIIPFLIKGYYYFDASSQIKPYFGIGLGMANQQNKFLIGIHSTQETQWGFSSTAELGANFLLSPESNIGMFAAVKYSYSNIKLTTLEDNNISRLNFNLGMSFLMYD